MLDVSYVETSQVFYTEGVIPVLRYRNVAHTAEVWMKIQRSWSWIVSHGSKSCSCLFITCQMALSARVVCDCSMFVEGHMGSEGGFVIPGLSTWPKV